MPTPPDFTNGTALDASSLNKTGLWLIKSQAVGTGVPSVTVTDAFSADYENYKIIWNGGVCSGLTNMRLHLGSATASGYFGFAGYGAFGGTTLFGINDNNAARFGYIGGGDTSGGTVSAEIRSPFIAAATYISAIVDTGTSFGTYNGRYFPTTSFTSFTISTDPGQTLTGGTVRVYGYRK